MDWMLSKPTASHLWAAVCWWKCLVCLNVSQDGHQVQVRNSFLGKIIVVTDFPTGYLTSSSVCVLWKYLSPAQGAIYCHSYICLTCFGHRLLLLTPWKCWEKSNFLGAPRSGAHAVTYAQLFPETSSFIWNVVALLASSH